MGWGKILGGLGGLAFGGNWESGAALGEGLENAWNIGKSIVSNMSGSNTSGSSSSSMGQFSSMQSYMQEKEAIKALEQKTGSVSSLGNLGATSIGTPTSNTSTSAYLANLLSAELGNAQNQQTMTSNNAFNAAQAAINRQFQAEEAQKTRDWQEEMSNTEYQRGVKDLQAAGLNPVLAAYNGYGASTPTGATASGSQASSAGNLLSHVATQQAMYEYSNNTANNLDHWMQIINNGSEVLNSTTEKELNRAVNEQASSAASTMSAYANAEKAYNTGSTTQSQTSGKKTSSKTDTSKIGLYGNANIGASGNYYR